MTAQRILFIKPSNSSFVLRDEQLLQKHHPIKSFLYRYGSWHRHLLSTLQLSLWLCHHLWRARVLFIWFSDYHSWLPILLASLLRKRTFLCVAGYDVACLPELNYGVFVRPFRGWCSRFSLRHADVLLPVARSLVEDIAVQVGKVRGSIQVVPFGFSEQRWYPAKTGEENLVLTVAFGDDLRRVRIKGLDLFCEAARALPEIRFMVIGPTGAAERFLQEQQLNNVQLLGPQPAEKLLAYYQSATVYAQFSIREGLPNAVIEAMLCGCIPVGTRTGGIPDAIEDVGKIVTERTCAAAVAAIRWALQQPASRRQEIRSHAIAHFSERRREQALQSLLD